jgi:Rps23 Pro-64 3,4-dihydroxylase Tpa1-like proline 4-hydroxylase
MNEKINKTYIKKEIIDEMRNFFENEGFIQLNSFFNQNYIKKIFNSILHENFIENYKPLFFRYYEIKEIYNFEIIKLYEFFKSKEFIEYIEEILNFEIENPKVSIRKYSHRNYTLLNDKLINKEDKINIIFDLTKDWKDNYGGILTYLTKEEEILYLEPQFNTLTIIFQPTELMKYLKYINNFSKDKQIIRFEIEYDICYN